MPLEPIQVHLTDGEKIEVLKRFQQSYKAEMDELVAKLETHLRSHAEADFVAQYLGEQPEVLSLKSNQEEVAKLEQRRQHIAVIIDRLAQVIPKQDEIGLKPPAQMRRY